MYVYVMKKDQLFAKIPPYDLFIKILKCFGLDNINDKRSFTRKHLTYINTVQKMEELVPTLKLYYIPCKARTYLNDLNEKNIVTILRQILKHFNYNIVSKEKYLRGEKYILSRSLRDCVESRGLGAAVAAGSDCAAAGLGGASAGSRGSATGAFAGGSGAMSFRTRRVQ